MCALSAIQFIFENLFLFGNRIESVLPLKFRNKMTNKDKAIKATYFSILGNIALALAKGFAGVFGNSYALIADAIESTTDVFSSILVLWYKIFY